MFDMFTLSSLVCRTILEVVSYKILMFQCPQSPGLSYCQLFQQTKFFLS